MSNKSDIKILGIVCSPRTRSNTEVLTETALDSSAELGAVTEIITVADKNLAPCDGCWYCAKTRKCKIDDDMQEIHAKILAADGIIFATPVYFWGMTAQAKIIVDRSFALYHGRRLRNKVAGVISVAGGMGATGAFTDFHDFFNIHRMVSAAGALGYSQDEEISFDERGGGVLAYTGRNRDIRQNSLAMFQAGALGKAMARSIKAIRNMKPVN